MPTQKETQLKTTTPIPIIMVLSWILIGTFLFHHLEDWTYAQSFYYSVVTLSTVGYGDLTPTTDVSRIAAAIYILIGVTIALGAFGYIGSNYLAHKEAKFTSKRNKKYQNK